MGRVWQDDGYYPVEPKTKTVHQNGQTMGTTLCGRIVSWCKNVMLIPPHSPWCPKCFPEEQTDVSSD